MKRLTIRTNEASISFDCESVGDIVRRLAAIEDILGNEYDLERLKFIMDAERHGGLIVRYPRDDPGPKGPPRCLPRLREIRGDILGRKNRRIYLCFVRLGQYRGRTTEGAG